MCSICLGIKLHTIQSLNFQDYLLPVDYMDGAVLSSINTKTWCWAEHVHVARDQLSYPEFPSIRFTITEPARSWSIWKPGTEHQITIVWMPFSLPKGLEAAISAWGIESFDHAELLKPPVPRQMCGCCGISWTVWSHDRCASALVLANI